MTSVLYSAGLNYQPGNPVRQEIVAVRRELESLRKQFELIAEENLVFRKYLMKLLKPSDEKVDESGDFLKDLIEVSNSADMKGKREAGGGTIQGAGFRH